MIPAFLIRPATRADLPALVRLKHQMNRAEHAQAPRDAPYLPLLDLSQAAAEAGAEEYWRWLGADGGEYLVAEIDGEVAGSVMWTPQTASSAHLPEVRAMALLMAMVVDERFRGHGIGRALMERAEAGVRAAGLSAIQLEVTEGNSPALNLYRRQGFAPRETVMIKPLLPRSASAFPPPSPPSADA